MSKKPFYSSFLRGWMAITVLFVAAFAMASPSLAQQTQAVTTASVNQRTGPGTSNPVVQVIPQNAVVAVTQCTSAGGWCETYYANRLGWVSANYLRFSGGQVGGGVVTPAPVPVNPPTVAGQVQAQATVQLNMRRGPSTSYGVVRAIPAGGVLTLIQCTQAYAWCEGVYQGSQGWVSARYLRSVSPQYNQQPIDNIGAQLGLRLFEFILGAAGVQIPQQPQAPRGPGANEVCFYTDANFGGQGTCIRMGQSDANVQAPFNDTISSIRFGSGAVVEVCQNVNYGGFCRTYNSDIAQLPTLINDRISSYRTTTGPTIPGPGFPGPVTGQACFYQDFGFQGQSFCVPGGQTINNVGSTWNDRISSIRLDPGVVIQVCSDVNFLGWCEQYSASVSQLPANRNDAISAIRVQ